MLGKLTTSSFFDVSKNHQSLPNLHKTSSNTQSKPSLNPRQTLNQIRPSQYNLSQSNRQKDRKSIFQNMDYQQQQLRYTKR